jgi:predicted nucleic acid binding AN1-type Zn finger protein
MKRSVRKFSYVSSAAVSLVLLFTAGSQALAQQTSAQQTPAQSGPSLKEQMTCRSDAGKFCAEHIGKPPQMNARLRDNKAKLSDACRKVVESHGG